MTGRIRFAVEDGVARITLCDVAGRNAFGRAFSEALDEAVKGAIDRSDARVILLDAEGPYFSVGGDLKEMRDAGDAVSAQVAAIARPVNAALLALTHGPLPVVSAWSGIAAGGGVGFALCGDMVVAAESARLTPGFTRSGLVPDTGLTWLLPRVLGHVRAFELLALNADIRAAQALEMGIVNRVIPDAELAKEAMNLAEALAAMPEGVLADTRRLLRLAMESSFGSHLSEEARVISARAGLADTRERLERFFAR